MKTTLRFFKPYIPSMLCIVVLLFGQAMLDLALPGYMADIIDKGIINQDMNAIYRTGAIMLAVTVLASTCAVLGNFFSSRIAGGSARDIRKALFHNVTNFSSTEMDKFSTASLITRSTNDIQMVQAASVMMLRMAIFAPIMGIGALIKAIQTSPGLVWTIAVALVFIIGIMIIMLLTVMPKFQVLQELLDRLNQVVGERLNGLLVVRAFNAEDIEEERFDRTNRELTKLNIFVNRCMSLLFPGLTFIQSMVMLLIVWVGATMVEAGNLLIGDMLAYQQYAMHVMMSFMFVSMMFIMIPRAMVSARRIGQVLDTAPSITDPEKPEQMTDVKGVVSFEKVGFAYPDAEEKTLSDITFTAEPGKTTAIIGGTGSGKTSLISLIPRLFDVTEGRVTIDGKDVRDLSQFDLRQAIGYVPQKGLLFSGTIADNLRYGRTDATLEDMESAADTAQALSFIREMPEGFETPVAQGGTSVSGGQKQRLAIARALIKEPKIYIFDDSFSALDFKTDAALRKALKDKVGDSTFLIVAQRINTIMDADQIIVLDDGKIAGIGTHEELLETSPVYREIAMSQLSEEELKGGEQSA